MAAAFIFQNQNQLFLNKSNEWVDGSESQTLLKTLFKDEALNIKAEQSVKNPELRLSIVNCDLNSKGHPQIQISETQKTLQKPDTGPELIEELSSNDGSPFERVQHVNDTLSCDN